MEKINILIRKLKLAPKNPQVIRQAFIHRSYLNETKIVTSSNERLEFLGDSILSYLVSDYLYQQYPDLSEGELTNLRSTVVKTPTLASIAKKLNLGDYLLLSQGEEEGGGRKNPSILADVFEAFFGAVYLECGLSAAKNLLRDVLFPIILEVIAEKAYKDAKSTFQEEVQKQTKISPVYKVIKETGPDHAKEFKVGAYVDGTLWGIGTGKNKQEAEQEAAYTALEKWTRR